MNTADAIKTFTAGKISRLLCNEKANASLAQLRRGVGHAPGALPELWGAYLLDLPEALTGCGVPSRAEWAIYIALTMFALHQQGHDCAASPMHRAGISLGDAARRLLDSEEDRERIARRFYPVATAADMAALSHHLRSLIALLRAKDIPLDYVQLAADLYDFQAPDTADRVRLRWGENFCRLASDNNHDDEKGL